MKIKINNEAFEVSFTYPGESPPLLWTATCAPVNGPYSEFVVGHGDTLSDALDDLANIIAGVEEE